MPMPQPLTSGAQTLGVISDYTMNADQYPAERTLSTPFNYTYGVMRIDDELIYFDNKGNSDTEDMPWGKAQATNLKWCWFDPDHSCRQLSKAQVQNAPPVRETLSGLR